MYKVVYSYLGWLSSAVGVPEWILTYKKGKQTIPHKGTGIFVFKELEDAQHFRDRVSDNLEIWRVETDNPRAQKRVSRTGTQLVSRFWFSPALNYGIQAPKGTYIADAVTLIERVE